MSKTSGKGNQTLRTGQIESRYQLRNYTNRAFPINQHRYGQAIEVQNNHTLQSTPERPLVLPLAALHSSSSLRMSRRMSLQSSSMHANSMATWASVHPWNGASV